MNFVVNSKRGASTTLSMILTKKLCRQQTYAVKPPVICTDEIENKKKFGGWLSRMRDALSEFPSKTDILVLGYYM